MEAFLSSLTLEALATFITSIGIWVYLGFMLPIIIIVGFKTGWGLRRGNSSQ